MVRRSPDQDDNVEPARNSLTDTEKKDKSLTEKMVDLKKLLSPRISQPKSLKDTDAKYLNGFS